MSRLISFESDFYKGVENKETVDTNGSPISLPNWSINNIRRLFFHSHGILVQYYVTLSAMGGGVLFKNYPYKQSEIQEDLDFLSSNPTKIHPILKVITHGRIMSSVEEIVFLLPGYNEALLKCDLSPSVVEGLSSDTRFPRLTAINLLNIDFAKFSEMGPSLNLKNKFDTVKDVMQLAGVPHKVYRQFDKKNWQTSTSLRPKYYLEDGEKLKRYFDSIKQTLEDQARQQKVGELDKSRLKEFAEEVSPRLLTLEDYLSKTGTLMKSTFSIAPMMSKIDWARFLDKKEILVVFTTLLAETSRTTETIRADLRGINFSEVRGFIQTYLPSSNLEQYIASIEQVVTSFLKGDSEGVAAFSAERSITVFETLLVYYARAVAYSIYTSFLLYLVRSGTDNVQFYYNLFKGSIDGIYYDRTISHFANFRLSQKNVSAGDVWDKIPAALSEFNLNVFLKSSLRVVDALHVLVNGGKH